MNKAKTNPLEKVKPLLCGSVTAIKKGMPSAPSDIDDSLTALAVGIESLRITDKRGDEEFAKQVEKSIEEFLPYRDEAILLFSAIAQYASTDENMRRLHRFFEALIPYMYVPESNAGHYRDGDWDNFRSIIRELFLYLVAVLIKHERFAGLNLLLSRQFHVVGRVRYANVDLGGPMINYEVLDPTIYAFAEEKAAKLLKERNEQQKEVSFHHLMQADFVLFMRAEIKLVFSPYKYFSTKRPWQPVTLTYSYDMGRAFEVFARSSSQSYFDEAKVILGIDNPSGLDVLLDAYKTGDRRLPNCKWRGQQINPSLLLGRDKLATRE